MDTGSVVLLVMLVLAVSLALRAPISLALLASGTIGLVLLDGFTHTHLNLGRLAYEPTSRYALVVIPFFLAMGVFVRTGTLGQDLFAIGQRLFGRLPGGLGIATVAACAGFAAVTGSSIATLVSVGRLAVDEMRRFGYSASVAAGVVGAAGTLGVLIPPSIAIVIYGIITRESIGKLLIAGIIPGILSAAIYGSYLYFMAKRNPEAFGGSLPHVEATGFDQNRASWKSVLQVLSLILVVVGGIYFGIVTVVEAAALGAIVAFVFMIPSVVSRRRASHPEPVALRKSIFESVALNSMVFALLVGAAVFTLFLVTAGVPRTVAGWTASVDVHPAVIIVAMLLLLVPLGMFLDPLSMMLITVPIFHPVAVGLGYDGIWFGILIIKMIELALITPPLGINAFVVSGAVGVRIEEVFRGLIPYFVLDALTIALLFIFPALVTWLPSLM